MTKSTFHPYHIVNESPWPILSAVSVFLLVSGLVDYLRNSESVLVFIGLASVMLTAGQWWRDVARESTYQGHHTSSVQVSLQFGMILFIVSEVMFFFSFFWAYFHSSLAPSAELGEIWPPTGISPFDFMQIPLLNTMILLASGVSVTWAHHSMLGQGHTSSSKALLLSILLGVYFSILQAFEYYEASFSMMDSLYGSIFYMATGFHGLHVIIGTTFLLVSYMRTVWGHFSSIHHFGFEAAAWYWHFVDVVWLFLFISIYWWGS